MNHTTVITNMGQDANIASQLINHHYVSSNTDNHHIIHRTGNYSNPLSEFQLTPNTEVLVLGDILKPEMIAELRNRHNVTVLDRHAEFITKMPKTEKDIFDVTCSLSELTWKYLYPDKKVPKILQLISDYETWTFALPETMPLHYGLGMTSAFDDEFMFNVVNDVQPYLETMIRKGTVIDEFVKVQDTAIANDICSVTKVAEHDCIIANVRGVNSLFFNYMDKTPSAPLRIIYGWIPTISRFRCSIYSDDPKVHAGNIARTFHGGGGPEVGGFNIRDISGLLPQPEEKSVGKFEDHLEAAATLARNPVVRTYIQNHERISVNSMRYYITLNGKRAVVCNLPLTNPELWFNARVTNVDIGIVYHRTKSGEYRVVITDLGGVDMAAMAEYVGGTMMPNGTIWKYTTTKLPWFDK